MNQLHIIGGLVRDPDNRTTREGKQVCSFTVGVNRRNDRDKSDYFRVNAWGELANICGRYLSKGKRVAVTGPVSVSTYTAQNGETRASMDVFAQEVEFLSPRESAPQTAPEAPKTDGQTGYVQVEDDDLPF